MQIFRMPRVPRNLEMGRYKTRDERQATDIKYQTLNVEATTWHV